MAFQSVPETAEVVINAICNNQAVTNTFYARKPGGYTLSDVEALAQAAHAVYSADMLDVMAIAYILNGATARGLEFENDVEFEYLPGVEAGVVASNPLPNNCVFCVKRSSAFTGRSARGRVFIGGLTQSQLGTDENFLLSSVAASIVTALNGMRTAFSAAGWTEVIVSRYHAGVKRSFGVTFTVIGYNNVDLRIDSQRNRLPLN